MFLRKNRKAKANIKGGKAYPQIRGTVEFEEVFNGVMVTAQINGLPSQKNGCGGRV